MPIATNRTTVSVSLASQQFREARGNGTRMNADGMDSQVIVFEGEMSLCLHNPPLSNTYFNFLIHDGAGRVGNDDILAQFILAA